MLNGMWTHRSRITSLYLLALIHAVFAGADKG